MHGFGSAAALVLALSCAACGGSSQRPGSNDANDGGTTTQGGTTAQGGTTEQGGAGGALGTGGTTTGGAGSGGSNDSGGASGTGGSSDTGGASGNSGTAGTGGSGNAAGTSGNPCVGAMPGGSCAPEGHFCGSCDDPCSFCTVLRCLSSAWVPLEGPPAPCFDCGNALRCEVGEAYCHVEKGGIYTEACIDVPAECEANVDCACLGPLHPGYTCSGETGSVLLERCCG